MNEREQVCGRAATESALRHRRNRLHETGNCCTSGKRLSEREMEFELPAGLARIRRLIAQGWEANSVWKEIGSRVTGGILREA
jgi:hypothetical protein